MFKYSHVRGDYMMFLFEMYMPKNLVLNETANIVDIINNNVDFICYCKVKGDLLAIKVKLGVEDEKYRNPITDLAGRQVKEAAAMVENYLLMQSILQEQDK